MTYIFPNGRWELMADSHKNFAYSTILTAPSPADSGTSLVVQSLDGAKFPTVPFNATVWPTGTQPLTTNAEIVRVTAISTDTFTITRAQESSTARSIVVGDQIAATITGKTLTDVETANLLDGVKADTVAQTVTRGSLIYGNSTPKWDELVVGAANSVLWTDGTDVSWSAAPRLANIADAGGTNRITTAASSPHVTLTGDIRINGPLKMDEQASRPGGVANYLWLYNYTDILWYTTSLGGVGFSVAPGEQKAMMFAPGQTGWMWPTARSTTPLMDYIGLFVGMTETFSTQTITLDSNGRYVTFNTSTTSGNEAGIETPNTICQRLNAFLSQISFALTSTANVRMFIGWTNQTLATMVSSDQPAGRYFGLQYSASRGDTTFYWTRKNDAGTFTATNTTVNVDTAWHKFRCLGGAVAVICSLFNNALTTEEKTNLISNIPSNSNSLSFVAGIETETTVAKGLSIKDGQVTADIQI